MRTSIVIVICFFLALLISGCSTTPAHIALVHQATSTSGRPSNAPSPTKAVVKSLKANLRVGPSRSSAVVTELESGEVVTIVNPAPTGSWYRVQTSNAEGWIHGNLIVLAHHYNTRAAKHTELKAESLAAPIKPIGSYH
jgi:uncharacterized protein YgiM (DUF1202 family)